MADTHLDPDLARDIDALCRLTGEFTLRSGQVSHEYFDKYLFEADPALLRRVVAEMRHLVPEDTDTIDLPGSVSNLSDPEGTAPQTSPPASETPETTAPSAAIMRYSNS